MNIQFNPPTDGDNNIELRFSELAVKQLQKLEKHYPTRKSLIIPALWIAQREYGGCLTEQAIREVAYRVGVPETEVDGVASFYTMFNNKPVGRILIEVCTNLTCSLCGGLEVLAHVEQRLGIKAGETTPDGTYTLMAVECVNDCGHAPVIQVGNKYLGDMTPEKIDVMLDMVAASDDQSVVTMADSVVACLLTERDQQEIGA